MEGGIVGMWTLNIGGWACPQKKKTGGTQIETLPHTPLVYVSDCTMSLMGAFPPAGVSTRP